MLVLALVMLALVMSALTGGAFVDPRNLRDILVNASLTAIAAAGMTVLIITAEIDISIGAILAVSAAVVATLAQRGTPLPVVLLAGLGTGTLLGCVNGALTAGLKIPSIVVTLATLGAIQSVLSLVTRGNTIAVPNALTGLVLSAPMGVPFLVLSAAMVCAAVDAYLRGTRLGRRHFAVGSNPRSAALTGIPVAWVTFRGFGLLGMLVGLASFLFAGRFSPVNPTPPKGFELQAITAVVVGGTDIFGGTGTIWGTVLAAVLLSAIDTALTFLKSTLRSHLGFELPSEVQPAIQGMLILAAVLSNSLRRRD